MKRFITVILILYIIVPMFVFLNPFAWGMRQIPHYRPSINTSILLSKLNKKYQMEVIIGEVVDTVWYFRDIKNKKISKLENFEFVIVQNEKQKINLYKVENYFHDFKQNFEHKKYFDSIRVKLTNNQIIYQLKM